MNTDVDIAIVGAGMIGSAMLASLLADPATAGLRLALVDAGAIEPLAGAGEGDFDTRVVALSRRSQGMLESVGAWQSIAAKRLCPYYRMAVWDGEGTGHIEFDSDALHWPGLGHIVENNVVLASLREQIERHRGRNLQLLQDAKVATVTLPAQQTETTVLGLEDGRQISARLVLAADGANSSLRNLAAMHTREWDYGHAAIVTTVEVEKGHEFTAWQRFTPSGPIALLPLSDDGENDRYCSLVWSAETDRADALMALPEDTFCQALTREFESRLGPVLRADTRHCIPLRQRHVTRYGEPGFALLGDAAHTIHPLAGLGANLGLADVAAMRDEVARACRRGVPLNDPSLVRRYQRHRQGHNLSVMMAMEGFKRLFAADDPAVRWARNRGMSWMNSLPWVKNKIAQVVNT